MSSRTFPNPEIVTSYVVSRKLKDCGENRTLIIKTMRRYPGSQPVNVDVLLDYVDRMLMRPAP